MSKIEQYAHNQHVQYEQTSQGLAEAKRQVAPDYDLVRQIAPNFCDFVLQTYFSRQARTYEAGRTDLAGLSVLDVGCGVGRVMEGFRQVGVGHVDGCDISQAMLKHAADSKELTGSQFFLTSGADTGASPAEAYDIVTSFLCFHHIPMRQTRIKMLEAIARNLKDGGICFIEFKIFPGATAAKIPPNHAHWSENMVARHTNSAADVWITPDALGLVYEDFRLFFTDIGMIEMDTGADLYHYDTSQIYQLGFNELYVVGAKAGRLKPALLQAARD